MSTLTGDPDLELPEFDVPPSDPIALAAGWLADAQRRGVREAGAAVLATADASGRPSARVVSVKQIDERGALFTSSTNTRKARDIESRPFAALTFYWRESLQQLRIAGVVEALSDAESDEQFAARPRGAQAASIVSTPGAELVDERELAADAARMVAGDEPLARPVTWRAYVVRPETIEFWYGRTDRLHRRLVYTLGSTGWSRRRVQP